MKTRYALISLICFVFAFTTLQAQVSIGNIAPGRVGTSAFSLQGSETIKIEGRAGGFYEDWRLIIYYGWIIDSETRKVVWHTLDKYKRDDFEHGEFEFHDEISLNKGTYELYFTGSYHHWNNNWDDSNNFGDFMDYVFREDKVKFRSSIQEAMGVSLSGQGITKVKSADLINEKTSNAVVSLLKPSHNGNLKKGFSLLAETSLHIYGIGEGDRDNIFDYAWIYDLDKHQRVWEMDYLNTDFAGGARKNLLADEKIKLPAGNYQVSYVTDDSHSYNDWNELPPNDPQFTGITIWAETDKDLKNVSTFKMPEEVQPVLQIAKVGDDAFRSQGLSVRSDISLRVLCIGEESNDELADYGWIVNAATREMVWDMADKFRVHAGGGEKNKMVDGTVDLKKGDYIVYYTTDDSHAYADWNSGPPHEQDYYGITLWAAKKEDLSKVTLFDPGTYKNDKVVVEIVRVTNDEQLDQNFTLDKDSKLRIFALGEGVHGEMVDYGWIKNLETGKVVWEMTYNNTESAGGDKKNRLYNDTIILPKGSYRVYYETDDSHSYHRWNATPPRDQEKYGISLYKELN